MSKMVDGGAVLIELLQELRSTAPSPTQKYYRHPAQTKGVTQGAPLFMALYGITLSPLSEELCSSKLELIAPFDVDYTVLNGLV